MLPVWLLAVTLYMCTSIHINFWFMYSLKQSLFWSHANLCSAYLDALEHKNFLRGLFPLNPLLRALESPRPPSSIPLIKACVRYFSLFLKDIVFLGYFKRSTLKRNLPYNCFFLSAVSWTFTHLSYHGLPAFLKLYVLKIELHV